jgi:hypothetical protein
MEQIGLVKNRKSGQEVAKFSSGRSRDDVRYWQGKVFRKSYVGPEASIKRPLISQSEFNTAGGVKAST